MFSFWLSVYLLTVVIIVSFSSVWADCGGRDKGKEIVEVLIWAGGTWAGYTQGDIFPEPNYLGHTVDKSTNTSLQYT